MISPRQAFRNFFGRPGVLYAVLGALAGVVLIVAIGSLSSMIIRDSIERDLDVGAKTIYRSMRDRASVSGVGDEAALSATMDGIADNESILGLGFCTSDDRLAIATPGLPLTLHCKTFARQNGEGANLTTAKGDRIRVNSFPLTVGAAHGRLLVADDLDVAERRERHVQIYVTAALAALATGFVVLTAAVFLALRRSWMQSLRGALEASQRPPEPETNGQPGADRRIGAIFADLLVRRGFAQAFHVKWTPESLRQLLRDELPGAQVITVSNREPYIHNRIDGEIRLQIPASGLVSALEPVMRACSGVWIAHGGGSADRETVDDADRLMVPPNSPSYGLRRVWLSEEEQDGYYFGAANEGLWPLCHIAFVRPTFREQDWASFRAVNLRFAEAVVEEATCENPIVLVQDYHFALLPRMIRDRLPKATIVTFWHIPWPNAETFSICPWREEILDGLLGSSILGFHTQFHCNNFFDAADRLIESRIDRENSSIWLRGAETLVRAYPISIEWPPRALIGQPSVEKCRANVRARFGLGEDVRIAVGVERFDYTKGILDRMRAVDDLLTMSPQWIGKFVLIQVAAPTRSKLEAYAALQHEAEQLANRINAAYARDGWKPIHLVVRHHEPDEVFELFRAADACVVSSLHDGMNLVAKEFVAARDDERGVLILSSFAGAARELPEALIVNPYDARCMAQAYDRALAMSEEEQAERMGVMAEQISARNVYRWAGLMLLDAAWLRKREKIALRA